ncbi:LacI family DNA-binding transcriptional regulator [Candidatus Sumerlaeota bacterium]|nr:LacI family DNA-binding transcriptional regulator [Candidatus Sumerlaeota bacterium]
MESQRLKRPNIKKIAEMAGVSYGTVSRVLNNSPLVKEKTRKRVLKIIKEIGYTPNPVARALKNKSTYTIGLIITNMIYPFFPQIVQGIEDRAAQENYSVIICDSQGDKEKEAQRLMSLVSRRIDGLIAAPIDDPENNNLECYRSVIKRGIPIVLLNYYLPIPECDFICVDDKPAAEIAVEYLIELGHRRIAFFHDVFSRSNNRLLGYQEALRRHNIPFDESLVFARDVKKEGIRLSIGDELDGYNFCERMLKLSPVPTAIMCSNDAIAIGAYRRLAEVGLRIPEDISVIGFDNVSYSNYLYVPLTTVSQPTYEIGKMSFELLMERIKEPKQKAKRILVQAELVKRRSCGPVREEEVIEIGKGIEV